jgi:anti-anti-sigma factor
MAELTVVYAGEDYSEVALSGKLDIEGCENVELRLTAATVSRNKPAIVDMSGVTLVASIGLGMIVRVAKAMQARRQPMAIYGLSEKVRQIFDAMKIDSVVPYVPTREDALQRIT